MKRNLILSIMGLALLIVGCSFLVDYLEEFRLSNVLMLFASLMASAALSVLVTIFVQTIYFTVKKTDAKENYLPLSTATVTIVLAMILGILGMKEIATLLWPSALFGILIAVLIVEYCRYDKYLRWIRK